MIKNSIALLLLMFSLSSSLWATRDKEAISKMLNSELTRLTEVMSGARNPFEVLGLDDSSSTKAVKKTYRQRVGQFHPDKLQAMELSLEDMEKAKEIVQTLSAAYEAIISDQVQEFMKGQDTSQRRDTMAPRNAFEQELVERSKKELSTYRSLLIALKGLQALDESSGLQEKELQEAWGKLSLFNSIQALRENSRIVANEISQTLENSNAKQGAGYLLLDQWLTKFNSKEAQSILKYWFAYEIQTAPERMQESSLPAERVTDSMLDVYLKVFENLWDKGLMDREESLRLVDAMTRAYNFQMGSSVSPKLRQFYDLSILAAEKIIDKEVSLQKARSLSEESLQEINRMLDQLGGREEVSLRITNDILGRAAQKGDVFNDPKSSDMLVKLAVLAASSEMEKRATDTNDPYLNSPYQIPFLKAITRKVRANLEFRTRLAYVINDRYQGQEAFVNLDHWIKGAKGPRGVVNFCRHLF